jgi:hypothetical protein
VCVHEDLLLTSIDAQGAKSAEMDSGKWGGGGGGGRGRLTVDERT